MQAERDAVLQELILAQAEIDSLRSELKSSNSANPKPSDLNSSVNNHSSLKMNSQQPGKEQSLSPLPDESQVQYSSSSSKDQCSPSKKKKEDHSRIDMNSSFLDVSYPLPPPLYSCFFRSFFLSFFFLFLFYQKMI